ncbi:alpha-latrotoxin-Lt1a [Zalerion maritima]|uniref:Alpha-latrotoxin-Lt1a n=1 Tax=Zalerion maritima TaxID=339359 RepID=A0AAD5RQ43_9PEZI|nr:alpha-latrotoxin-Lt1a [Zalerion maritima]
MPTGRSTSVTMAPPNLNTLPAEIILMIAHEIYRPPGKPDASKHRRQTTMDVILASNSIAHIARISRTCRRVYEVLLPYLVGCDIKQDRPKSIYWAAYCGSLRLLDTNLAQSKPLDPNTPWLHSWDSWRDVNAGNSPINQALWIPTSPPHINYRRNLEDTITKAKAKSDHVRTEAFKSLYRVNPPDFKDWGNSLKSNVGDNRDGFIRERYWSALHIAIANGNINIAKRLIEYGADPVVPSWVFCNCRGPSPQTEEDPARPIDVIKWDALHMAICHSGNAKHGIDSPESQFVLELLDTPGLHRDSLAGALCSAAFKGDLELVKLLLAPPYQVDVNASHDGLHGVTPLSWAFHGGHVSTVAPFLVEKGANVETLVCRQYSTRPANLLEMYCIKKKWDYVRLLLEMKAKPTWDAFEHVSRAENVEIARLFIDRGLEFVSQHGRRLESFLGIFTSQNGTRLRIATLLMQKGLNFRKISHAEVERAANWPAARTDDGGKYTSLYEFIWLALDKKQLHPMAASPSVPSATLLKLIAPLTEGPLKTRLVDRLLNAGVDPSLRAPKITIYYHHSAIFLAFMEGDFDSCRRMMECLARSENGTKDNMLQIYAEMFSGMSFTNARGTEQLEFIRASDADGNYILTKNNFIQTLRGSFSAAVLMIEGGIVDKLRREEEPGMDEGEDAKNPLSLAITYAHEKQVDHLKDLVEKLLDQPGVDPSDGMKAVVTSQNLEIFTLLRERGGELKGTLSRKDMSTHDVLSIFGGGELDLYEVRKDLLQVILPALDLARWPETRKQVFLRAMQPPVFFPEALEQCIAAGQDVNKTLMNEMLPLEVLCAKLMKEIRSLHGTWKEDPEETGLRSFKRCVEILEENMGLPTTGGGSTPSPAGKSCPAATAIAKGKPKRAGTPGGNVRARLARLAATLRRGGRNNRGKSAESTATPEPQRRRVKAATGCPGHGRRLKVEGGCMEGFWDRFDKRMAAFKQRS